MIAVRRASRRADANSSRARDRRETGASLPGPAASQGYLATSTGPWHAIGMRMTKILAVLLMLTVASCGYDVSFNECAAIHCDEDSGCPDGLTCGDNRLCRSPGATCGSDDADAGTDAPPSAFPSCAGLAATCGPTASDDCCSTATTIPGGTFYRSYDVSGDGMYPSMNFPATVSAFVLDKYEVTVGRFRKFVSAGMGTQSGAPIAGSGAHAAIPGSGWDASWNTELATSTSALIADVKCDATYQTWTDAAGGDESLPMNCVTWYEAMAFCIWDGAFLPTEAEWNFAAAGGDEQRAYPWSSPAGTMTIDCSYANYDIDVPSGTYCVNGTTGGMNRVGSESPKGDGKWGQADLAGDVFEWTLDWYANPYPTATCNNCANLTPTSLRAIRGGGFNLNASTLRTGRRLVVDPPTTRFINAGFRCARSP
jgi:formylglycine-generating enzyme